MFVDYGDGISLIDPSKRLILFVQSDPRRMSYKRGSSAFDLHFIDCGSDI